MIRAIAVVLIGTGALMMVGLRFSYMNAVLVVREAAAFGGMGVATTLVGQLAAPILKIVTGLGLFTLKRWAWYGALAALVLDVVTLGVSVQRYHGFGEVIPPALPQGMMAGTVVQRSSILPVYFILLLSLLSLVVMITRAVRVGWREQSRAA